MAADAAEHVYAADAADTAAAHALAAYTAAVHASAADASAVHILSPAVDIAPAVLVADAVDAAA